MWVADIVNAPPSGSNCLKFAATLKPVEQNTTTTTHTNTTITTITTTRATINTLKPVEKRNKESNEVVNSTTGLWVVTGTTLSRLSCSSIVEIVGPLVLLVVDCI